MNPYAWIKKPFFGRYMKPWAWPEQAERSAWTPLKFDNGRGAVLAGLYGETLGGGKARGNIVCAHPMGVEAKGYYLKYGHGQRLREGGFNVLLFDFNGFGESGNGDILYPLDVVAAARALRERAPGLPLGALGLSFGAAWTLSALSEEEHGIQAVAVESAFTTLEEYWHRYLVPYVMLRVLTKVIPGVLGRLRPIVQMGTIRGSPSLLLIYGDQDTVTPPSMGERLIAASSLPEGRRSMWVVPGAKHVKAMTAAPEAYPQRLVAFFSEALGGRGEASAGAA